MSISKLLSAAAIAAASFAMIGAPVSIDPSTGTLAVKAAFAKKGADDKATHDVGDDRGRGGNGKDDAAGDDRGRGGNGKDDGPNHR